MCATSESVSSELLGSAGRLRAALGARETQTVSHLVLSLRREIHQLSQGAQTDDRRERLVRLSQGLRQIERAARAGDFADARRALALWTMGCR